MKKPFLHALVAALYIAFIVLLASTVGSVLKEKPDTIIIPMTMLSLFVLSAAVMGFLFVYEPVRLLIENKKKDALMFFGKTVAFFACFVAGYTALLFFVEDVSFYTSQSVLKNESSESRTVGFSWVEGDYKYTITEREAPFYSVAITNNRPECLTQEGDMVEEPACSGAMYWAKDGIDWVQMSTESVDCAKIVQHSFPIAKWPQCY